MLTTDSQDSGFGSVPILHTIRDQAKIWAHFQGEGAGYFAQAHPRMDALTRRVARLVRVPSPIVLNIGWGDGYIERQMLAKGWRVHALDPDERAMQKAAAQGVEAHVGVIEKMPLPDGVFDAVITSEVLEHLSDDQRRVGLAEAARVLRAGGWVIGTVPYKEILELNIAVCPHCGERFHRWGHQKAFDLVGMRSELCAVFASSTVRVTRTAFPAWTWGPWRLAKTLVRVVLARLGAGIAQPSVLFMAQKPPWGVGER